MHACKTVINMFVFFITVIDFSPQVNISDPVFGISNVTVDITIQQDEHNNLRSYVSSLVMYNISFSSTIVAELKEYRIDSLLSNLKVIVPYNVHVLVSMSIVPTLCGRSVREVPFNTSFYYSKLLYTHNA